MADDPDLQARRQGQAQRQHPLDRIGVDELQQGERLADFVVARVDRDPAPDVDLIPHVTAPLACDDPVAQDDPGGDAGRPRQRGEQRGELAALALAARQDLGTRERLRDVGDLDVLRDPLARAP